MDEDSPMDAGTTAVYDALRALGCTVAVDPADPDDCADVAEVAVAAYRRWVIGQRPDAGRLDQLRKLVEAAADPSPFIGRILAALADETAARQQAEEEGSNDGRARH
jgi:hypothetical protein